MNWKGVKQADEKLPRHLHEAQVMITYPAPNTGGKGVLRGIDSLRAMAYTVNVDRLRRCLGYLHENNDLYSHVDIDESVLQELQDDYEASRGLDLEQAVQEMADIDTRYTSAMNLNPVPTSEIGQVLQQNYAITIERTGNPVRAHAEHDLLAQSFPSLFPKGGGKYRVCSAPLTTSEFLEHTIRFGDPRFSKHMRYLFMMVNIKNLDIAYRSIGPSIKGGVTKSKFGETEADSTDDMFQKLAAPVCVWY